MNISNQQTTEQQQVSAILALKIAELGYTADFVKNISVGPVVSIYRFIPTKQTRVSHLEALGKDFSVALGLKEDVLVKRFAGDSAVCVFVPNKVRASVYWRDLCSIHDEDGKDGHYEIPLLLGVNPLGDKVVDDLTLMPHLLVAGSTGSGKSTWLSSAITTMIFNRSPAELKLVLIDLKHVEFNHFSESHHLISEPAYSIYQALEQLDNCVVEMEKRLKEFARYGARNILEYNKLNLTRMPYIVVVIDEIATLTQDTRKEDEDEKRGPSLGKLATAKLCQLAEKARATGIHMIAATQRPTVKVVDGNIKANFPSRISFKLVSRVDSQTILDTGGAEQLLNRGDMLYLNPNKPGLQRIHAALASLEDIKACLEFAKQRS